MKTKMLVLSIILGSVFIQLSAQDFNKQRCAIDISSLWPAEGLNRNYSMHELKGNVKSVECTMKEAIILDGDTTYNGVTPESYDIVSQKTLCWYDFNFSDNYDYKINFNKDGNMLNRHIKYPCVASTSSDDKIDYIFNYNEEGKLISQVKQVSFRLVPQMNYTDNISYSYLNNKMISANRYRKCENGYKEDPENISYNYDEKGRLIQCVLKSIKKSKEKVLEDQTYEYDANNNIIKRKSNDFISFIYDKKGNIIKETMGGEKHLWFSNDYKYNATGQLSQILYYNDLNFYDKNVIYNYNYKMNDKGQVTEVSLLINEQIIEITNYSYYPDGKRKSITTTLNYDKASPYQSSKREDKVLLNVITPKLVTKVSYIYDDKGNWIIKRLSSSDNNKVIINKRVIEYY